MIYPVFVAEACSPGIVRSLPEIDFGLTGNVILQTRSRKRKICWMRCLLAYHVPARDTGYRCSQYSRTIRIRFCACNTFDSNAGTRQDSIALEVCTTVRIEEDDQPHPPPSWQSSTEVTEPQQKLDCTLVTNIILRSHQYARTAPRAARPPYQTAR